jgi:hypothetical protein
MCEGGQRGRDDGLADPCVGAADDQDAHATIAPVMRSRSSSLVTYGGIA